MNHFCRVSLRGLGYFVVWGCAVMQLQRERAEQESHRAESSSGVPGAWKKMKLALLKKS